MVPRAISLQPNVFFKVWSLSRPPRTTRLLGARQDLPHQCGLHHRLHYVSVLCQGPLLPLFGGRWWRLVCGRPLRLFPRQEDCPLGLPCGIILHSAVFVVLLAPAGLQKGHRGLLCPPFQTGLPVSAPTNHPGEKTPRLEPGLLKKDVREWTLRRPWSARLPNMYLQPDILCNINLLFCKYCECGGCAAPGGPPLPGAGC